MSGYQQYGGNPYSQAEAGHGGYGESNPYGSTNEQALNPPPPLAHGDSEYSQGSQYSMPGAQPTHTGGTPLSREDFLARTEGVKSRINHLTSNIQEIASIHQRLLSSPDDRASRQLESIVSDTQVRNTQIKDEIKFLERDAVREPQNSFKKVQIDSVKRTFKTQLEEYRKEESSYSQRYREAIARQYRIVNPDATEAEVQEAANADWGDEGIFQQALKSNRSGQASSVLGAVRARHNDIQRIEATMSELATLFIQLDETVQAHEPLVQQAEMQTEQVVGHSQEANKQLDTGIEHAKRARRLKWWTLLVVVLIIAIIALVLGLYFGLKK
jgi:syntaxin 1B/2/3